MTNSRYFFSFLSSAALAGWVLTSFLVVAAPAAAQQYKTLEAQIQDIMDLAEAEGRELTPTELREIRNLRRQSEAAVRRPQRDPKTQAYVDEINAIVEKAQAEDRALTLEEGERISELRRLANAGRRPPANRRVARPADTTLAQRNELAERIGRSLGLFGIMHDMSDRAVSEALTVLTSLGADNEPVWRAEADRTLGRQRASVYGGEFLELEDLQIVSRWLESDAGRTVAAALDGWQKGLQQVELPAYDDLRREHYNAIANSAIWVETLFSSEFFGELLPQVLYDYTMSKERFDDLWSAGPGYRRRDLVPLLANEVIPRVFADVDDQVLADYAQFQNSPPAQRVFAKVGGSVGSHASRLLRGARELLKRYGPAEPPAFFNPEPQQERLSQSPEQAVELAREVVADSQSGLYPQMLRELQQYEASGTASAEMFMLMGRLSYRMGTKRSDQRSVFTEFDTDLLLQAESYLDKSVAADPQFMDGHSYLGYVAIQLRKLDKAEKHLELAFREGSESEWLLFNLADLRTLQERNDEAVTLRLRAFRESPSPNVRTNALQSLLYVNTNEDNFSSVWEAIDDHFGPATSVSERVWYSESLLTHGSPERVLELLGTGERLARTPAQFLARAYLIAGAKDQDASGFPTAEGEEAINRALQLWPDVAALVDSVLRYGHYSNVVPAVLRAGHDLRATGSTLHNPITWMVNVGAAASIRNAVDAGLSVNQSGSSQVIYPIHVAAYLQSPEMISLLLELGADPTLTNSRNQNALAMLDEGPRKESYEASRRLLENATAD